MSTSPMLEVRDLAIGWSPEAVLIDHATFVVEAGEIFGILGRSASGKSTMLRALIGLEPPLAGEVRVMGKPPVVAHGRPEFGVMFQHGALFGSATVGENIEIALRTWTELPADAISAIGRATLSLVGLEAAYDASPATLSGGMRKRAAIARALVLAPPLLFLDEPSSGLDPITSAEIDRMIEMLVHALGLTVVLVTHELGSIETIVDRCILLDTDTRSIVATGRPSELVDDPHPRVRNFFTRTPEAT